MKALLIPVDGPPREVDLADGGGTRFMRSLRALIGTRCVERIWITRPLGSLAGRGRRSRGKAGQPGRHAASRARSAAQFSLLGAVVIVGLDKDADRPAALSPDQVGAILRRITGAP